MKVGASGTIVRKKHRNPRRKAPGTPATQNPMPDNTPWIKFVPTIP